jgi:hypothetical protein
MITQERLKDLLHYDPETGFFSRPNGTPTSRVPTVNGYVMIMIKGKRYYAHRLAFLYMIGRWPLYEVDHINRIRHDNTERCTASDQHAQHVYR